MLNKYAFAAQGFKQHLRAFFPDVGNLAPVNSAVKMVWRNNVSDGYKISEGYHTEPMDLSNYLLLRSREHFLFKNKLANKFLPGSVLYEKIKGDFDEKSFKAIETDLESRL